MPERSGAPSARPARGDSGGPAPSREVAEFIRFCHRRRRVGWPELYDEMCGVAARREFKGWGHEELAEHGVTFTLYQMPQLATWVRQVIGASATPAQGAQPGAVRQPAAGIP